jgi:hypothetical protein
MTNKRLTIKQIHKAHLQAEKGRAQRRHESCYLDRAQIVKDIGPDCEWEFLPPECEEARSEGRLSRCDCEDSAIPPAYANRRCSLRRKYHRTWRLGRLCSRMRGSSK